MESLKIRDKKQNAEVQELIEEQAEASSDAETVAVPSETPAAMQQAETVLQQDIISQQQEKRAAKLTFGQSLMEKVKKFFEEVE